MVAVYVLFFVVFLALKVAGRRLHGASPLATPMRGTVAAQTVDGRGLVARARRFVLSRRSSSSGDET